MYLPSYDNAIGKKWLSSPANYGTKVTDNKVSDAGLLCDEPFH